MFGGTVSHQDPNQLKTGRNRKLRTRLWTVLLFIVFFASCGSALPAVSETTAPAFPPALESYNDAHLTSLSEVLRHRIEQEPVNLWVTLIFIGALVHAFFTHKFLHWSHVLNERQKARSQNPGAKTVGHASIAARVLHFLGEVEAVFGIWCIPLLAVLAAKVGWDPTLRYFEHGVSFTEPLFVVVIMAVASTRPILQLTEDCLSSIARLGGGKPGAWWLTILTVGPVLGSLITEPAAMTISALLLAKQFYSVKPSARLSYATLGLLFVNVSVGGVLTHFAAPPVLMVARPWGWDTAYMARHFGWIALVGIVVANAGYYLSFRREFKQLASAARAFDQGAATATARQPVPLWLTAAHVGFMVWAVLNAHHPALLVGSFLFFIAFYEVTADYQSGLRLRSSILVGFFLAGLVVHGGLQQWWIAPVLGGLKEIPLMLGAMGLTAVNDNAAITYLATLVPDLSEGMRYAVVAGAVVGGGLTVIANAPNPAGQSILKRFFSDGISPLGLFLGALPATLILAACFLLFR